MKTINWTCNFKNTPKQIKVGDILHLSCKGDEANQFGNDIKIEFLDEKQKYQLKLLKVGHADENNLNLYLSSYKTGELKNTFKISDGKSEFLVSDLPLKVESVLSKDSKPNPSFGPWKEAFPIQYSIFWGIFSIAFFTLLFLLLKKLFSRKNFIKRILDRKSSEKLSTVFVRNLRRKDLESKNFIQDLEILFKKYLEDMLYIECIGNTPKQISEFLKEYHFDLYQKRGRSIYQFLEDMAFLKNKKVERDRVVKLKKICFQLVFDLEEDIL